MCVICRLAPQPDKPNTPRTHASRRAIQRWRSCLGNRRESITDEMRPLPLELQPARGCVAPSLRFSAIDLHVVKRGPRAASALAEEMPLSGTAVVLRVEWGRHLRLEDRARATAYPQRGATNCALELSRYVAKARAVR